ncbi:MAG: GDYXXLXY domain-containing protein [Deltaproteobacteria bacterium]|nr:GDYXXLXY domain-containing protein [Deltaproteobacteria bacterium]
MRKAAILVILAVFFAGFLFSVARMENLRVNGVDALLPLAPVDPRALLLGDYMTLEFAVNDAIMDALRTRYAPGRKGRARSGELPASGLAVVMDSVPRDGNGKETEARGTVPAVVFARLDDGAPLAPGERYLAFKVRGSRVITASTAFYFREGDAVRYERARFGRVKIGRDGKTLLVALCDGDGRDIKPGRRPGGKDSANRD